MLTEKSSITQSPHYTCNLLIQVLGEAYSTHDEEDMAVKEVTAISISQGRYVRARNCPPNDASEGESESMRPMYAGSTAWKMTP